MNKDFKSFATANCGVSGATLNKIESKLIIPQAYINPTILEERQLNVTQMDVFSRLMADRIIFLGTEIDDEVANSVVAQLLLLDSENSEKDIMLYINSPGGVITAGMAIYDTMNLIKSDVSTICLGDAASMGAFLLSSGAQCGGRRMATENAEIMIHQVAAGTQGKATDMEIAMKHTLRLKEKLNRYLAEFTGQEYKKVHDDCERDKWLTSEEALEYGLIDEVIE